MFKDGRKSQEMVLIDHLIHFLLVSMPQDSHHDQTAEAELLAQFDEGEENS